MKYYSISWSSRKNDSSGTDLIKSGLDPIDVMKFYFEHQPWIEIKSIKKVNPHFSELTKSDSGEFLLDGEE